ncbi:hypothetical protein ACJDU8_18320 [Clostridium sp. WILCCON 0269]|uniref:Uncharacterized protein n=1 Tax=Candidatus Clostridium eludens TaxID=3381663 RepID=A0ABW8SN61_9CLOT
MVNLDSLEQKSTEENYSLIQPAEELDKLNNSSEDYNSIPEDDISPILLVLCAAIPMVVLIILFI